MASEAAARASSECDAEKMWLSQRQSLEPKRGTEGSDPARAIAMLHSMRSCELAVSRVTFRV